MASETASKSESFGQRVKNFFSATFGGREDAQPQQSPQELEAQNKLAEKDSKERGDKCCGVTCRIIARTIYVVLSGLAVLKAFAVIALGSIVAVAIKFYATEQTNKAAALIIVVVSAGATIALVLTSVVYFFRKDKKKTRKLAVFLLLLGLFQIILTLVAVTPNQKDRQRFEEELAVSFQKLQNNDPAQELKWSVTQSEIHCCGLDSPEDYRTPNLPLQFPPNVHVSCCPNYDPRVPSQAQERERELCKQRRQYYTSGCVEPLVSYFKEAGVAITSLITGLFFLQIFLAIYGLCCGCGKKRKAVSAESPEGSPAQSA